MRDRPFPFAGAFASIAVVLTDRNATDAEQAFIAALERHREELRKHCMFLVRSPADAEDALQETLLRAWRYRRTLTSDDPRPWLYRIATNACRDVHTRTGPHCTSLEDELSEPPAPRDQRPDVRALERETVEHALLTALRYLPPRQHTAFVLRDLLCCSSRETAAALSISVPAANSAVQRARIALRTKLDRDSVGWPQRVDRLATGGRT
jgi:RNA polymerase sigma factor (sigma-70 family)